MTDDDARPAADPVVAMPADPAPPPPTLLQRVRALWCQLVSGLG